MSTFFSRAAALACAVTLLPAYARAQEVERVQLQGDHVAIYNLAGSAAVVAGSGSAVVVEVRRGGRDAARLEILQGPIGDRQTLRVRYPDDRIVFRPADGSFHGETTLRVREDGTFGDGHWRDRDGDQVRIRGSGSGLEAHADLRILVPAGRQVDVYLAVGRMDATGVSADLRLDGGSTTVTTAETSGNLVVDVGSGGVRIRGHRGAGNVDTGSGSVDVTGVTGDELTVDTGSGSVTVREASVQSLNIDTGSGRVLATAITADAVNVETGSGSVDLEFGAAPRDVAVDTGSGSVTLTAPAGLNASLSFETSSGEITTDFPVQVTRIERDALRGTIGSGGGRLTVETGSGNIALRRR